MSKLHCTCLEEHFWRGKVLYLKKNNFSFVSRTSSKNILDFQQIVFGFLLVQWNSLGKKTMFFLKDNLISFSVFQQKFRVLGKKFPTEFQNCSPSVQQEILWLNSSFQNFLTFTLFLDSRQKICGGSDKSSIYVSSSTFWDFVFRKSFFFKFLRTVFFFQFLLRKISQAVKNAFYFFRGTFWE